MRPRRYFATSGAAHRAPSAFQKYDGDNKLDDSAVNRGKAFRYSPRHPKRKQCGYTPSARRRGHSVISFAAFCGEFRWAQTCRHSAIRRLGGRLTVTRHRDIYECARRLLEARYCWRRWRRAGRQKARAYTSMRMQRRHRRCRRRRMNADFARAAWARYRPRRR